MKKESILNVSVSTYRNYYDSTPMGETNLLDWLNNGSNKTEVEQIRQLTDKKEKDKIKATLPCITPSGLFTQRNLDSLTQHSGFICIDIDRYGNKKKPGNEHVENFHQLKDQLKNIDCVAYCGLSVSGEGYFLLIPIAHPEKHTEHFLALQEDFKKFNLNVDEGCKDVCRLRGYSYDETGYFNHNAVIYTRLHVEKVKPKPQPVQARKPNYGQKQHTYTGGYTGTTPERIYSCVNQIVQRHIDITQDEQDWFRLAFSLASELGADGEEYFHCISQFYAGGKKGRGYDYQEASKKYNHALKNHHSYKISIGTFFKLCSDVGIYPEQKIIVTPNESQGTTKQRPKSEKGVTASVSNDLPQFDSAAMQIQPNESFDLEPGVTFDLSTENKALKTETLNKTVTDIENDSGIPIIEKILSLPQVSEKGYSITLNGCERITDLNYTVNSLVSFCQNNNLGNKTRKAYVDKLVNIYQVVSRENV